MGAAHEEGQGTSAVPHAFYAHVPMCIRHDINTAKYLSYATPYNAVVHSTDMHPAFVTQCPSTA
jgi:hypothetical protein